jgi:hypothetical protein
MLDCWVGTLPTGPQNLQGLVEVHKVLVEVLILEFPDDEF